MANLTSIVQVLRMFKAECNINMQVGVANDLTYYQLLHNMQRWLAAEWDWPFLNTRFDVVAVPSSRYLDMPTNLDTQRPYKVEVKYNDCWQEVAYGISSQEYNYIDSDKGITLDPVQRWKLGGQTGTESVDQGKFEIWPMPGIAQTVRFTGQRLTDSFFDSDGNPDPTAQCDLDDMLVVLFTAAEQLSRQNQKDAQIKLAKAQQRLLKLRATYPVREQEYVLGRGEESRRDARIGVPLVVIHG